MKAGKLLKETREKQLVTQRELAKLIGYEDGQVISNFERGTGGINTQGLKKICSHLGLSLRKIRHALVEDYDAKLKKELN